MRLRLHKAVFTNPADMVAMSELIAPYHRDRAIRLEWVDTPE